MRRMLTPRRRRLWAWRAAALVPAWLVASFLSNGYVPVALRVETIALLLVTLYRPALGLMLVAVLAPLGDVAAPFLGGPPMRQAETLVVTFLAGWLSARGLEQEGLPPLSGNLVNAITVFAAVVVASVASNALQLGLDSPQALNDALRSLAHDYLLTDDPVGAHAAGQLIEGLGLLAAAALIAREPRDRAQLRLSLVASGLIASVASGLLGLHIAPLRTLSRYAFIGKRRFSAITGDVNAAGSSYLLYLGVTAGIAAFAWPTQRRIWIAATVIVVAGLAITGSATAIIAALLVLAFGAIRHVAWGTSRRRQVAGGLVLATVIIGGLVFARSDRSTQSLGMRGGFTQASVRLIEARPILGIGVGRYYPLSLLVLPPDLSWVYGRENAHDYYLQIVAELGLLGLLAFGWVVAAAMGRAIRQVWHRRADGLTAGCVAGASAYLVTALTGHPFLVPETVIPFWLVLGLIYSDHAAAVVPTPRWRRGAALGFASVLLLTAALRSEVPAPRLSAGEDGFGPPQIDATSGQSFREAGLRASLFVPPAIRMVEIPMRMGGSGPGSVVISAVVPGTAKSEMSVGRDWGTLVVRLPGPELMMRRQRINLAVTAVSGLAAGSSPRMDIGQIRIITTP